MALSPLFDEPVDAGNDPEALLVDRRADLHRISTAQQRLDGSLAVVHARRYGDIELRQGRRAKRHAAQDIAQFRRFAERVAVDERHALHVDIGFEEAVEHHHTPRPARQQRIGDGKHIGQAHRQFHRHRDLHGSRHAAHDIGVVLLQLLRRTVAVGRLQEDVQFQGCGPRSLHGHGVVRPSVIRRDAVDAGDDGYPCRTGIGDEFEKLTLIRIAEVTFEVFTRIAHALRRIVQRGGMTDDLLLEDGFQDDSARAVRYALSDIGHSRRIGRTADHDGTRKVESEVFCFHITELH